jgi:hypothetical protein
MFKKESTIKAEFDEIEKQHQLVDKVCQWFAIGQWFSRSTPVSSTSKTDRHDINEI